MQTVTSGSRVQQTNSPTHLIIEGLVARPQQLTPEDVASLPRISSTSVLQCEHKAEAGDQVWAGISLREIIRLAQPHPEARYVRVHAQNYSVPFALDEIDEAILVETLDGQPLSQERGAPWRIFVPGSQCHVNVKWVDRLEVTASRGATAEERAERARTRGRIAGDAAADRLEAQA
jgi:DMSO/TMAO reductase YedYZ molybdopterin-dependent catalytic subunit